jgi:hypothetical protein
MSTMPPSPFMTSEEIRSSEPAVSFRLPPGVETAGPISNSAPVAIQAAESCGSTEGRAAGVVPAYLAHGTGSGHCDRKAHSETQAGIKPGPQDHIAEIFVGARKLEDHRFVLDEISFFEAIEEAPLFLRYRSVGYMR